MERKFEADKALMDRDFHTSPLKTADVAFERDHPAMMSFFTEASNEFDGEKGYTGRSFCNGSMCSNKRKPTFTATERGVSPRGPPLLFMRYLDRSPSSPTYVPEDPSEDEIRGGQADDGDGDDGEQS